MKNTNQSFWSKVSNSATFKAMVIGILILLMLIPVSMISSLIQEREWNSESVASEISSKWGNRQAIVGPVITVPFQYNVVQDNKITKVNEYAYFLPEDLDIQTELVPEIRYRSIYKVVVYQSKIKVKGKFLFPDFSKLNHARATFIDWQNAFITIGISDLRGIRNDVAFRWNGVQQEATSGVEGSDFISSGITVKMPLSPETSEDTEFNFDFELSLNGSHGLFFAPLGKTTHTTLSSQWDTPSFDGAFLPDKRTVGQNEFSAEWNIFNYNRNFPQMWAGDSYNVSGSEYGVQLLLPVDHYQKTMRSVKYAIMFIALTFLVFFLIELISRKCIHPFQYLLVSIGLVLFYSLLLAISEQIGFDLAYGVSALAIIILITAYSHSIFKSSKQTWLMGAFLVVLYAFLYTVLQLEDFALLIGSVGLFIALAVVMYISRKIDWFHSNEPDDNQEQLPEGN